MRKIILKSQEEKRKLRIRKKISGTSERPRISVFKSNTMVYAQLIDDLTGRTLASAHGPKDMASAFSVGERLAQAAVKLGISKAVFDRKGYKYHGKIKQLADGARKGGLDF